MSEQHPGRGNASAPQPSGAADSATVGRTGRDPIEVQDDEASAGEDADYGDAGPFAGETSSIFDTLDMLCEESANTNWTIELLREDTDRLRQESDKINSQLERLSAAVESLKAGMSKIEQLAGAVEGARGGIAKLEQDLAGVAAAQEDAVELIIKRVQRHAARDRLAAIDEALVRGLPDLSQELRRGIEMAMTDLSTALHHSDQENANRTLELLTEFRATTRHLEALATARPERRSPGPTR